MKNYFFYSIFTLLTILGFFIFSNADDIGKKNFDHLNVSFQNNKIIVFNENTGRLHIHKIENNNTIWNPLTDPGINEVIIKINTDGDKISLLK